MLPCAKCRGIGLESGPANTVCKSDNVTKGKGYNRGVRLLLTKAENAVSRLQRLRWLPMVTLLALWRSACAQDT
jgi:hypothetical protein